MTSVVPWLTLRGLHTDRLEGFSADHRLAFRGLPAECLVVRTHEAASFSIPLACTGGGHGWLPQEGLSWAGYGTSNPRDLLVRGLAASQVSECRGNSAAIFPAPLFFGNFWEVGWRTVVDRIWAPIPPAGATCRHLATRCGSSRFREAEREFSRQHGCPPCAPVPISLGRGISVVGTWI